jgi:hypothetical protein
MQIRGREVDFRITRLKDAAAMEKALDHMAAVSYTHLTLPTIA